MNCKNCKDIRCAGHGDDFESPDCDDFFDENGDPIDKEVTRSIIVNNFVCSMTGEPEELDASYEAFFGELEELLETYFGNQWSYSFDMEEADADLDDEEDVDA
jgi:hypothetical protein